VLYQQRGHMVQSLYLRSRFTSSESITSRLRSVDGFVYIWFTQNDCIQ